MTVSHTRARTRLVDVRSYSGCSCMNEPKWLQTLSRKHGVDLREHGRPLAELRCRLHLTHRDQLLLLLLRIGIVGDASLRLLGSRYLG
jgi:hypothetical protein